MNYWNLLENTVQDLLPIITIFIVTISLIRIAYLRNHREKIHIYKELINLLAAVYILLLFELLTKSEVNYNGGMNLIPFQEIMRFDFGSKMFFYTVFGNIIIFIPLGYFIAFYVKPKNVWAIFIVSLLISLTVETVQLYIGRSFDVDDIILNVIGAVCGYLLYIGLNAIKTRLPKPLQRDGFYNFIALILVVLVFIYIFGITGVIS